MIKLKKILTHFKEKRKRKIRKKIILASVLLLLIIAGAFFVYESNRSLTIGVCLFDPVNDRAADRRVILEWAQERINNEGGINGHKIKLVYGFIHINDWIDTTWEKMEEEMQAVMRKLIKESRADIIVGEASEGVAPVALEEKKILISPNDTSGFLFRAYGKKDYLWRISQSDVAQIRTALHILSQKGVKKISYLGEYARFGNDYYDWIGFFAKEFNIEITDIKKYQRGDDVKPLVKETAQTNPEYIIAYAIPEDAIIIKQELNRLGSRAKLFLSDQSIGSVGNASLFKDLGGLAEGLEGTNLTYNPDSGFLEEYRKKFNREPDIYVAQTYDALLLAAYIAARQEATFFENIVESTKKIAYAQGEAIGWQETKKGLALVAEGKLPNISGASGPLDYDVEYGVDPVETYYEHWQIKDGLMQTIKIYSTDDSAHVAKPQAGAAVARSQASDKHAQLGEMSTQNNLLGQKEDTWAVVVAASNGWDEYRHQADALGVYDMLKQNGIKDDKIILMIYDDVAWAEENNKSGEIYNQLKGKNLRKGAEIDYTGDKVSPKVLSQVLAGKSSVEAPIVLASGSKDNVFLYIVDHGLPGAVFFNNDKKLTADDLNKTVEAMQANKKYRQLFIMVDTCFGESVGEKISAPNVLYFSGANKTEPSFGAEYDPKLKQWLADEFTNKTLKAIANNPEIEIEALYYESYNNVIGSHVTLSNYANFGDIKTPISEFIAP
ncbi:MAG: C13 family peptidase [Patescibacteria group bacterium]